MEIVIIYGSENDKPYFEPGITYLEKQKIGYQEKVLSAHRDLDELIAFLEKLNNNHQVKVVIAVAGLAAALPGIAAVKVKVPVIGVPVPGGPLNGIDALLAIIQVPGDVPLVSVGLHKKAPINAALVAERIINLCRVPGK